MKSRTGGTPTRAEIRRAFSHTLRDLRYRANLSQEGIALEVGIDRTYMSALERAKHVPSLEIIYKLLSVLELSFVEFAVHFDYTLKHESSKR